MNPRSHITSLMAQLLCEQGRKAETQEPHEVRLGGLGFQLHAQRGKISLFFSLNALTFLYAQVLDLSRR